MSLFTDGPINGPTDLQNYESAILDVAGTEGIDIGGKGALAQSEICCSSDAEWTPRNSSGL